ncbi:MULTISPECIES: thiolase family protein [unclassified Nocardioides]|uniref:thiolase family protein n=1 Tax=unclassified Nocardioides TaxID=2615069 RepID=UPI0007029726|nr:MULTISPECIES: thiolase family protein [unclassified Nocardioides]KQP65753.1 acetyl-CoA acetyltransferase [Nocardioides sp. Leaf285]KQQ44019.1 acetyl-CoA acetyltransferase [Nocardioides sp. Leaf307]
MRDAVIVEAIRTPVGKRGGGLSAEHPVDLSADLLVALAARTGLDPALVDDVHWGCVHQVAEQTYNVARNAVIAAGWPESVPGTTLDRQCGSSQQAVHSAAAMVVSGQADIVVAGGVEVMSRVPMGASVLDKDPFGERFAARYDGRRPHMGLGAEEINRRWSLTRTQLDEFALSSHEKAAHAQKNGLFESQIVPVTTADGVTVEHDEGIRPGGSLEKLAGLRSVFAEDGLLTAGNSSSINDGAAALLVMTGDKARELGMTPIARVHTAVVAGDDPIISLTALIPATRKAMDRSGLSLSDIGVFEVSEAFASVPLAWQKEIGADPALMNPHGGAISIGHPLGASGARLMTTMVHHMREAGVRYGLQTMCEGGGLSNATILELL